LKSAGWRNWYRQFELRQLNIFYLHDWVGEESAFPSWQQCQRYKRAIDDGWPMKATSFETMLEVIGDEQDDLMQTPR
jgi:hypothetical protein